MINSYPKMKNIFNVNSNRFKSIAIATMYCFVLQIVLPLFSLNVVYAQSGPGQAEAQGMTLETTSGLVNKFTGDFSYSIPLMDVEGYPITISYNQNVGMDTEASWVGLGWDLNLGSVSRQMRGLPDEFNGDDKVDRTYSIAVNKTEGTKNGVSVSAGVPVGSVNVGIGVSALWGKYENSYNGYGKTKDFGLSGSFSVGDKLNAGISLGIGYNFDSQNGAGRSTNLGLTAGVKGNNGKSKGVSASWNGNLHSRAGKSAYSIGLGVYRSKNQGMSTASASVSSTHSLGSITSVPKLQFGFSTNAETSQKEFGLFYEVISSYSVGADYVNVNYEFENALKTRSISQSAFGYMHFGKRTSVDDQSAYPIMDYNSSNITELSEESKKIPFSAPTYDMFNFSGAGSQGQFRAQRDDVGTLRDATVVGDAKGEMGTFNAAIGIVSPSTNIAFKIGYTDSDQTGSDQSGSWIANGAEDFEFISGQNDRTNFDKSIFVKSIGELTPSSLGVYSSLGESAPMQRMPVALLEGNVGMNNVLIAQNGATVPVNNTVNQQSNGRQPIRATHYNLRTAKERSTVNSQIQYKELNSPYYEIGNTENRINNVRKSHHISSPEIITPAGLRYVYDIPVYSKETVQTQFSASGMTPSTVDGLVTYDATDASVNNPNGKMKMFDQTTTPSYAHSFMLTEMYSPDYVDVDQNGPTPNDQGNYYKLNYSKVHSDFSWKMPISGGIPNTGVQSKAFFSENFNATQEDDIANYTTGTKEVVLVQSLESKNMVAEFVIEERRDAHAVTPEGEFIEDNNSITNYKTGYCLKEIRLYNKNERYNNVNAVPLQVVEFDYDYSLCENFPLNINNYTGHDNGKGTGKLTLKAIRFKNKNSEELALAPYVFEYSDQNANYNPMDIDRWGNFKKNDSSKPNNRYPYVNQNTTQINNETLANESAQHWKLTQIRTPQNGLIEVDYEADIYRHVQDKKVMNLYEVVGMTNPMKLALLMADPGNIEPDVSDQLRTSWGEYNDLHTDISNISALTDEEIDARIFGGFGKKNEDNLHEKLPNNVLVFKFDSPYMEGSGITRPDLEEQFQQEYLTKENGQPLTEVYCKTRIKVDANEEKYESIPTFAGVSWVFPAKYNPVLNDLGLSEISSSGLLGVGGVYNYGYIILDIEGVKDVKLDKEGNLKEDASLYHLNPIHKAALQFSKRHLPEVIYADCNGTNCDYKTDIDRSVIFGGDVNDELNKQSFCLSFIEDESFVRLYKQDGNKYSSNARVASITYRDNWSEMTGPAGSNENESVYKWEYSYGEPIARGEKAHGVAAYEPQIGKDENPFYQWTRYTNIVKSYPDQSMFTEEPFAEILFPSPVIGYSEVEVKFDNPNQFNNTGRNVTNYLTAYDYPTISESTNIKRVVNKKKPGVIVSRESVVLTQGYSVQTNNFHGQIKEVNVYDALDNIQSKTKYNYNGLDQQIGMINRDGELASENVATEIDFYADSRYIFKKTKSINLGATVGIGWFLPSPVPTYSSFSPNVGYVETERGFYTTTFNKIINRSAIVSSIETEYLGSKNTAKNIAYDKYSGNVLVSSLKDEYNDELYSMVFPAHWYYDNFRNFHKTENKLSSVSLNGSIVNDANGVFTEGDILTVENGGNSFEAQVLARINDNIHLINLDGTQFNQTSGQVDLTLKRTMRKNMIGTSMQSITTKDGSFITNAPINPVSQLPVINPKSNIISNSVLTFKEGGAVSCYDVEGKPQLGLGVGDVVNPYTYGLKGVYRIANSFAFQSERTNFSNAHGTRFDGIMPGYLPFYDLSNQSGEGWKMIDELTHPSFPTGTIPSGFDFHQGHRKLGDIAKIDEFGKAVQSTDQIDVHSAVLYGYNNKLKLVPIAQAVNAEQNQIAYDGFEDYTNYQPTTNPYGTSHFDFNVPGVNLTNTERHSGLKSLELQAGENISVTRELGAINNQDDCADQENPEFYQYAIDDCDCAEGFKPTPGKYLLSAWVKVDDSKDKISYDSQTITVSIGGNTTTMYPVGSIIDGWQKIEGAFDFTTGSNIAVTLVNDSGTKTAYYDDLRIHPFLAGMTTVVYDPKTFLPLASHDGYNYTTFFNYDENYNLVGTKVETKEGIKSISSSEGGFVKSYKAQ